MASARNWKITARRLRFTSGSTTSASFMERCGSRRPWKRGSRTVFGMLGNCFRRDRKSGELNRFAVFALDCKRFHQFRGAQISGKKDGADRRESDETVQ